MKDDIVKLVVGPDEYRKLPDLIRVCSERWKCGGCGAGNNRDL